jgi:hypothetical protein
LWNVSDPIGCSTIWKKLFMHIQQEKAKNDIT